MQYLLLGLGLFLLVWFLMRSFVSLPPARLAATIRTVGGLIMVAGAVGLFFAGLYTGMLLMLLPVPLLLRPQSALAAWRRLREGFAQGGAPREQARRPNFSGAMTREEACAILGVKLNASDEEIRAAYNRLIRSVHPDRGGSAYLSAQLNQAKAALLGE
jgi:DnaJ domain